jgi:hypothetical protein
MNVSLADQLQTYGRVGPEMSKIVETSRHPVKVIVRVLVNAGVCGQAVRLDVVGQSTS